MITDPEVLAYLAGLFDGEGSFTIQLNIRSSCTGRPNFYVAPRLSMSLKYGGEVLDEFRLAFGGTVHQYKALRYWVLSSQGQTRAATRALLPYLRIKRQIGGRFLEAVELMPQTRKNHSAGERTWTVDIALRVSEIALSLNSYKKSPKTIAYLDDVRAAFRESAA